MGGDEYERIFGALDEDGEDVRLTFQLDAETNARFREAARARGVSLTELLRDMIRNLPDV